MKNWQSLHYYTENTLYTLYYLNENMYTTFLLFFFKIFKVYSRQVSSSSVSLLKEKSKSVQSWLNFSFFDNVFKVIQTLVFNHGTKSVHFSFVEMPLFSQRLKLFPVLQHILMSPVSILPFLLLSSCSDEHSLSSLSLSWFSCFFNSWGSFFVTHIQMEYISSWNGPTIHVLCFMLARTSTKTFVRRIHIR